MGHLPSFCLHIGLLWLLLTYLTKPNHGTHLTNRGISLLGVALKAIESEYQRQTRIREKNELTKSQTLTFLKQIYSKKRLSLICCFSIHGLHN